MNVIDVANELNCSPQYVRKLLREGRITGDLTGDVWTISSENLQMFERKDLRTRPNPVSDKVSLKKLSKSKLNCLSFFSGAMGLDIGLEKVGINVLLACEIDNASRKTIVCNDPKIGLIGDVRDYTVQDILEYANLKDKDSIDIIVGGPPCQAFSTAGKRLGFEDERGNVFLKFIDLIININPSYAVIENVRGLMSSTISIDINDEITSKFPLDWKNVKGSTLFYIKKKLENAGYLVSFNLYNSANFGTPQVRERIVIICTKLNNKVGYLNPTNSDNEAFGLPKWKTFKNAVENLNSKEAEFINFSEKRLKYIKMLNPGENWRNLPEEIQPIAMGNSYNLGGGKTGFYRRLNWDKPSPTIVTHPAMPATELAHPTENRPLSVQEYKRLQEFPDEWQIQGSILEQYKQIGNAVPVGLGEAIGKAILHHKRNLKIHNPSNFPYSRYNSTNDIDFEKHIISQMRHFNVLQSEINFYKQ